MNVVDVRRVLVVCGISTLLTASVSAQDKMEGHAGMSSPAKGQVRITSDELHRLGGVPKGWRFTLPAGDAKAGREVFAKLECYKCHEVKGAGFPTVTRTPENAGPELTTMGGHHPAEYFAESIINPNAVIVTGTGHTGKD